MPAGLESLKKRRRGRCTGTTFVNHLGTSIAYDVCWMGENMMELEITIYRDDPGKPDRTTRESFVIYGTQKTFGQLGEILSAVSRHRPTR